MPPELNEEQILAALDRLSPQGRRKALQRLLGNLEKWERLVEKNQAKLEAICRERGLDFGRMSEDEKAELIDQILHQP
jgi:hypothetical protein